MLKIVKSLVLSTILALAVVFGFLLTNQQNKALAYKTDGMCYWVDQGHLECKYETWVGGALGGLKDLLDKSEFSPSEIPFIGGPSTFDPTKWDENLLGGFKGSCVAGSDCDGYYYAPEESANAGYPIFYSGGDKPNHAKYLHFVSQNPLYGFLSDSSSKISKIPNSDNDRWIAIAKIGQANKMGDSNKCGIINTTNCDIQDDGKYSGKALDTKGFLSTIESIQSLAALKKQCESTAPLPFILCPIFDGISGAISNLIGGQGVTGERSGLLISFLTFSPLDANKKPEALQAIVGSIVSIANAFYIIVFLLLIFSSSLPLGLDNYTIKKTLPKFIGAVIMTQFAYLICGVVIDFFNLLGNLVPNVIFALPIGSGITGGGLSGLNQGLQAVLAVPLFASGAVFALAFGWIFIIMAVIIIFVAVLVAFVYMVLRYLILFILVLLAPIAFASWVLPGTEKFFKLWWKNFIRLNAMFPMITGLIAVSIVVSQILLATNETNTAVKFVAVFIPVVALFAVPRTLKWTTDGMSAIAGGILGATAGKMNAGGRAVSKGTKMAAKKGYNYGKTEGIEFGKRRLAQSGIGNNIAGRDNIIGRRVRQEQGRILAEQRKRSAEKYSAMSDLGQIQDMAAESMRRAAANPNDLVARADAQAAVARLSQLGGRGRNEIATLQDQFRAAGGAEGAWKGILGDAGVMGDLEAKAPELTGWDNTTRTTAGPASPFRDVQVGNETYRVHTNGIDLSGKGAPELGKLGTSSLLTFNNAEDSVAQLENGINWQAAASMAGNSTMHPTDANAIGQWQEIGRRGVAHYTNLRDEAQARINNGTSADVAADQARLDEATRNIGHAQAIIDGFGG